MEGHKIGARIDSHNPSAAAAPGLHISSLVWR